METQGIENEGVYLIPNIVSSAPSLSLCGLRVFQFRLPPIRGVERRRGGVGEEGGVVAFARVLKLSFLIKYEIVYFSFYDYYTDNHHRG